MKKINNIIKAFSMAILVVMSIASKAQTQAVVRTSNAENKVAILPMTYIADGSDVRTDEMPYHLQNLAYQYLAEDAFELKFQDPAQTNAILLKRGIRGAEIRKYTPGELPEILNVEYVVVGLVNQESIGMTTFSNSRRDFDRRHWGRYERETHRNTHTTEQMSTTIDLDIYNDKGEKIYSRSRRSILSNIDAYKAGLHYLLKRTPLHKR